MLIALVGVVIIIVIAIFMQKESNKEALVRKFTEQCKKGNIRFRKCDLIRINPDGGLLVLTANEEGRKVCCEYLDILKDVKYDVLYNEVIITSLDIDALYFLGEYVIACKAAK